MKKSLLALCLTVAFGVAFASESYAASEPVRTDSDPQITEHHWGGGYHRGRGRGWNGGGGGWGGGCGGGGYYYDGY